MAVGKPHDKMRIGIIPNILERASDRLSGARLIAAAAAINLWI
jgi:hypothetical protein